MQKKEIINSIKIVVLALILTGAIGYAWTAPGTGVIPPNDNVPRPINVSLEHQVKDGGLSLGALLVTAGSQFNGELIVASGNPSAGKVLTASNSSGLASWQAPASGSGLYDYSQCSQTTMWKLGDVNCPADYVGVGSYHKGTDSYGYCCKLKDSNKVDFTNTRFTSDNEVPCNYDEVVIGWKQWNNGFKCAKRTGVVPPAYTCWVENEANCASSNAYYRGEPEDPDYGGSRCCSS